jgi:hypothetical protein
MAYAYNQVLLQSDINVLRTNGSEDKKHNCDREKYTGLEVLNWIASLLCCLDLSMTCKARDLSIH